MTQLPTYFFIVTLECCPGCMWNQECGMKQNNGTCEYKPAYNEIARRIEDGELKPEWWVKQWVKAA